MISLGVADDRDDVYCRYAFICIRISKTVTRELILIVNPEGGGMPVRVVCQHHWSDTQPGSRECRLPGNLAQHVNQHAQSNPPCAASAQYAAVRHAQKGCVDQRVRAGSPTPEPCLTSSTGRPIAMRYLPHRYRDDGVKLIGGSGSDHSHYHEPTAAASPANGWPLPQRCFQVDASSRNDDPGHAVEPAIDSVHPDRQMDRLRPNGPAAYSAVETDGSLRRCDPARQTVWKQPPARSGPCRRPRLRTSRHAVQLGNQLHPRAAPVPSQHMHPVRNAGTCLKVATTGRPDGAFIDRSNRFSSRTGIRNIEHLVIHNASPLRRRCAARIGRLPGNARGRGTSGSGMPGDGTLAASRSSADFAAGKRCPVR